MAQTSRMSWQLLGLTLGLITFACARPTRADVSSSQVITAIRKGVHYLLKHQRRPKPWEETDLTIEGNGEKGGESALVLESLLTVGQSLHMRSLNIFNPPMQRAIKFVAKVQSPDTYVVSLQANAMALLPPKTEYLKVLRKDRSFLRAVFFRRVPTATVGVPMVPTAIATGTTPIRNMVCWECGPLHTAECLFHPAIGSESAATGHRASMPPVPGGIGSICTPPRRMPTPAGRTP